MRGSCFYSTVVALSVLASGTANACLYHDPGSCGLVTKTAPSPAPVFGFTSSPLGTSDAAFPSGLAGTDAHGDGLSSRHGQQQGLSYRGELGRADSGSSSSDQLLAALFDPEPSAKSDGPGGLKLGLGGPGWVEFADRGLDSSWKDGGGRGEGYPSAAPLPASWTMMLIGLALFGLLASYRKIKRNRLAQTGPALLT